jgi:hypothetical protein
MTVIVAAQFDKSAVRGSGEQLKFRTRRVGRDYHCVLP